MMNRWTLSAACAAALTLAACGSTTPTSAQPHGSSHKAASAAPTHALLQAYHWTLDAAQDSAGARQAQFHAMEPKERVQLDFVAGAQPGEQIIATKVCNYIRGSYSLQGEQLKVGRLMSTQMACLEGGLSQLERAVGGQLEKMQSVRQVQGVPAPKLVVGFSDGSQWQLSGTPTDATRYGSAGETLFLEIDPQTKPCVAGELRKQCLMVRELKYDQSGRKTVASDWQYFYAPIRGYEHDPRTRNVLRVKRYPVKNPPADASSAVYVLDMRVESELVKP